jgi:hypothetical protein
VNNFFVAALQHPMSLDFRTSQIGFFAYNEDPTIAVAMLVGFRARHKLTRPFLCPLCFVQ